MNPYTRACLPDERLSKSTLLAMLPSHIDYKKVIEKSSGQIINIENMDQTEVNPRINDGSWVYFEDLQPRRILLTSKSWRILSFNPSSRNVCVQMFNQSGMVNFTFVLPQFVSKF